MLKEDSCVVEEKVQTKMPGSLALNTLRREGLKNETLWKREKKYIMRKKMFL